MPFALCPMQKTRNIKLTIEYDGTFFKGWQIQDKKSRTIQGEIQKVLSKLCGENIRLIASGRTDSGVHALEQIVNFKTSSKRPLAQLQKALNAILPHDITIRQVVEADDAFHARYSVKSKTYRYTILNRETRSSLDRNLYLLYPWKLDLQSMRQEARSLVGRHDFKSFQASDPARKSLPFEKSSVRSLKRIEIKKRGDYIRIDIEANGFLYKMARNIIGSLLEVGRGHLPKESLKRILARKERIKTLKTAPPQGLCLINVRY